VLSRIGNYLKLCSSINSKLAHPEDQIKFSLRAYPVTCGVTFSFGGLQINTETEVLNTSGALIKDLYASGDTVGLFFHNYPSCTGQVRNAVFSMTAGRNAVKDTN